MSEILIYNKSGNPDEYDRFSNEIKKNANANVCLGKPCIITTKIKG